MRRLPVLAALAVAGLTTGIGTGHALAHRHEPVRTVTIADEPAPTTTTTTVAGATTTTTTTAPSPSTTVVGRPEPASPTTTVPAPEPTPTTVAPRAEPAELTIGCTSGGGDPSVSCHWDGIPAGTTRLVLLRERPGTPSQPLWSTTDPTARDHVDESAEVGVTYVYRVTAYDAERFLETSNGERIKAGGGEPAAPATTMSLTCAATGAAAVRCTWGDGPVGTAGYRLVRSVDDRRGRVVAQVGADARSADDADVAPGPQTYYVQALDGTGKVVAVGRAEVDCCTPGDR